MERRRAVPGDRNEVLLVAALRRKLGGTLIQTRRGLGYLIDE